MFHSQAQGLLDDYVVGSYQLNPEGAALVFQANEGLPEEYFSHLDFPVSDFWYDYFSTKIEILPPPKYDDVLDVCCGTGTLCLNVMRKGLFSRCTAIDSSAVAIGRLRRRMTEMGLSQVRALEDNVMRTSLDSASFDAIVGNSFLHHLPDNRAFLTEAHRLLRDNGTICFTGEPTVASNLLETAILGTLARLLRRLRIKPKPKPRLQSITDIWVYEEKKIRALLQECGFGDVTITPFGVTVPLFNSPTAYLKSLVSARSLQPEFYWKYLGIVDRYAFAWLPADWHSHFVISARKR